MGARSGIIGPLVLRGPAQGAQEGVVIEEAAWAAGANGVDLLMGFDAGARNVATLHQVAGQRLEAGQLALGGRVPIEVADQTDAEAARVKRLAREMSAIELAGPAAPD